MIFLDKTCQSQFHWGKNYDMEADHLRALLQKYAANQDLTSLDSIPKEITFCVYYFIFTRHGTDIYRYNITPTKDV